MMKSNYEVQILVNGHPVREYYKDGCTYIEGRKGVEFSLRVKNNGYRRILAIPTIDGVSVLNGKEAGYNSPGYVIDGYNSTVIDGWRTSREEIAKFYFTNPSDSYGRRTNKKDNLGVIGVAIFREKERIYSDTTTYPFTPLPWEWWKEHPYKPDPWWEGYRRDWPWYGSSGTCGEGGGGGSYEYNSTRDSINCCNQQGMNLDSDYQAKMYAEYTSPGVSQDVGTGFGKSKESYVNMIEFDKETHPDVIFTIFYNTREQLGKIGIDFSERPRYVAPQAFPNGFCEPPKQ